ncbi:AGO2 [Hepatospora eriocheir]|uniref:AGO2 n=1 Tax=Hepatospora eriocheir TaxID=1081669 RepID=A0A1X0Q7J4_9MICR|nr:AGO2 [Hepatospora eriocheir]
MVYNNNRRQDYNRDDNYRSRPQTRREDNRRPPITEPTEISLKANLYEYVGNPLTLYKYSVTIVPEVRKAQQFNFFHKICEHNNFLDHVIAFDGYNTLVSNENLGESLVLEYPLKEGMSKCTIEFINTYKSEDKLDNSSGLIECLDVITRYHQRLNYHVQKRKVIAPGSKGTPIAPGREIISGLSHSFMYDISGKLFMNVQPVFDVYYKPQPLIEMIREFQVFRSQAYGHSIDRITNQLMTELQRLLKGLRLRTIHRDNKNRTFVCREIIEEDAMQKMIEFEDPDTPPMCVADYFAKHYKPLQYPNLPLIKFKVRGDQYIFMPMEVLEIPESPKQKYNSSLTENMTAVMIKEAAKRPVDRFAMIESKARELQLRNNNQLEKFGVIFNNNVHNCQGLMLPAPKIVFGGERACNVNNGSWNLVNMKALQSVPITSFKIFAFREFDLPDNRMIGSFLGIASKYGMYFEEPILQTVSSVKEFTEMERGFMNLVILPNNDSVRYGEIKRHCETYKANFTQCMLAKNRNQLMKPAFVSNLLMKINTKIGGKNFGVDTKIFGDKPTMIFGIDVSHPGISEDRMPTIAAVVGSLDYDFITHTTDICAQEARKDVVVNLQSIIVNQLKKHFNSTGIKPERIIIFREGINDSAMDHVFSTEIAAIKDACVELEKGYLPEINFIVSQTRHNVRFGTADDCSNLQPGSFVSGLGNKQFLDFFLVSANALQGTAKPTRYVLFYNESGFTQESLYNPLFSLCHLFQRATKSVSQPPCVRYAHLACQRGRFYIEPDRTLDENTLTLRSVLFQITNTLYYV